MAVVVRGLRVSSEVVWLWGRQLSTDRETEPVIGAAREIGLTRA